MTARTWDRDRARLASCSPRSDLAWIGGVLLSPSEVALAWGEGTLRLAPIPARLDFLYLHVTFGKSNGRRI